MTQLNGWLGIEQADKAFAEHAKEFVSFKIAGAGPSKPGVPIWCFAQRLLKGEHLPVWNQETGDCVSMGVANALDYLTLTDIVLRHKNIEFKRAFPPFIYGVSRTAKDCGNGQLRRQGGSVGAWAATAAKNYGVLFMDDPDVPKYSGAVADDWGYKGVPEKFYKEASDNIVKSVSRLETVEQVRDSLINYFPVTIASTWGFVVKMIDGVKTYIPSGQWGHQMCYIAWRDDPFPAAFRLNSWGNSTGAAVDGEPIGGAWQRAEDMTKEFRSGVELYSWSAYDGYPAADSRFSFI